MDNYTEALREQRQKAEERFSTGNTLNGRSTITPTPDQHLRERPVSEKDLRNDRGQSLSSNDMLNPPRRQPTPEELHERVRRKKPWHVKWTKWMNSKWKNYFVTFVSEFVGTTSFLFFAFGGTVTANIEAGDTADETTTGSDTTFDLTTYIYIAFSFGFSLMVNAWIFYRISGGLFNPAVTLALTLTGDIEKLRAGLLFIAQLTGAIWASYLVSELFPAPFNVQTALGDNTTIAQGIFIEALCTCLLVFTIIMLAKEKHRATHIAPVGIGLALFVAELVAVYYTGGSLNPARTFGPAVVARDFLSHQYIYWVGPLIGSVLAVGFFEFMKILEYEMANPGQDGDEENDPTQNLNLEVAQSVEERALEIEVIQDLQGNNELGRRRTSDLERQ